MHRLRMIALAAGIVLVTGSALAADPEAGADAFDTYCSDCHSVSPKSLNRKGPTLFNIVNRRAGSVAGFKYSADMAKSGIVWSPARIDAYLTNPKAVVPAGIMKFKGLKSPEDRADIIAFLESAH